LSDRQLLDVDDLARSSALLPDDHVLVPDDADLVAFLLGGQHCSFSVAADGRLTWRGFGGTFQTLGELRNMAREHPMPPLEPALPKIEETETVGLELFGNMLDTIAFLRVRLRALADVVMEKGLVTGPELLGKYAEYHDRSFEAFRDLMLLRPEVFEKRFGEWLATEHTYRATLSADRAVEHTAETEP
jgi:hypothetical protein